MKLLEVFRQIKEQNLDKSQLEDFHKELSELRGQMRLELADITKKKAMFLLSEPEKSVAQRKVEWGGTPEGQREIDLKAYIGATGDNLGAVKSRLFSIY